MRYHTIVADPPWPYPDDHRGWAVGVGARSWRNGNRARTKMPYPSMALSEIEDLAVSDLAADDAHLYLWTTTRHLHAAFHVVDAWQFRHSQTLVWAKTPLGSFLGGAFGANVEFVLFCRRGSLATSSRHSSAWFEWPRAGVGSHSRKPDAFLDLVEQTSPGPYLELFARRQRLGWDTWGNEALPHVELAGRLDQESGR